MNQPTAINRDDQGGIVIRWDDQQQTQWTARQLRQACPCATCREKHGSPFTASGSAATGDDAAANNRSLGLPVLTAAETRPLQILAMQPTGNYAYQIHFSDGHRSGIYSLELLRRGP